MNNSIEKDITRPCKQRFLDSLPPFYSANATDKRDTYDVKGLPWFGDRGETHDALWRHETKAHLRVQPSAKGFGYQWRAGFQIGPEIWANVLGLAATIEEACAKACACDGAPRLVFNYLGTETHWYEPKPNYWVAALDGEEAKVIKVSDTNYLWCRHWRAAAEVLALVNLKDELLGRATTLDEAVRAAIDAPGHFKRACAALVATLTAVPAGTPSD